MQTTTATTTTTATLTNVLKSDRSYLVTLLLCFFLGGFGAHRFYVGKVGTAILMLFTLGGLGIWALIDLIIIATGNFKDKQGKRITFADQVEIKVTNTTTTPNS